MSDTSDTKRTNRTRTAVTAVIIGCVLTAVILVVGPRLRDDRGAEHAAVVGALPVDAADRSFREIGGDAELVALVKALYAAQLRGQDTGDELARYGSLLLARAREGTIDLQKADPDEDLMAAILVAVRRAIAEHPRAAEGDGKK